jgi:hypothetical protein
MLSTLAGPLNGSFVAHNLPAPSSYPANLYFRVRTRCTPGGQGRELTRPGAHL